MNVCRRVRGLRREMQDWWTAVEWARVRVEKRGAEQWLSVVVVCKKRCVSYVIDDLHLSNVCTNASNVWCTSRKEYACVAVFLRANINTGYCTQ